jgi:Ca-activated chloride channel homolog
MTFAQPIWILAGLIVCIGVLFLLHSLQSARRATLEKFAAAHLVDKLTGNVSTKRQTAKKILLLLALLGCFIALARPQYGFRWEDIKRKGIDILFAVDTSKSMLARDIKPDRLERAKYAIMDFVDQLDGDRVGLLPFAGTAYLMCPLTGDYSAFDNSLKAVDTSLIPKGGTDIAAAIREAETVLNNEANYKLLILITDGENLQGDVLAAAKTAAAKGMRIFTVGVGTREGEIIPIASGGSPKFVKDPAGNFVVSHLDEATLTQIAKVANGVYVPLGNRGQGLQTIYQQKLSLVPKEELTQRRHKVPLERFQWPLAAAIVFFSLEFIIGTRKTRPFSLSLKKFSIRRKAKNVIGSLLLILSLSLLIHPAIASASDGEQAYRTGDFNKASEMYDKLLKKHPDDPKLQYNFGTASYKNKKFDEAIAAFTDALKTKDLELQEQAYYNRGNALYRKGQETLKTDSQTTLAKWRQAVDSYTASLELNKDDQDAIFNRTLVKKRIEELNKQQKNQPKNQNSDKNQQNKDKKESKDKQREKQNPQNSKSQNTPPEQNKKNEGQKSQAESGRPQKKKQKQAEAQAEKAKKEAAQARAAAMDKERRKEGKMTKEDAEQLLDSLKSEEGKLNFVPNLGKNNDNEPRRDW